MERTIQEQDSRTRILVAATQEFSEKGFDGARVNAIAQKAGVNKALIYYYFKSKEEILEELFRGVLNDTLGRMNSAFDRLVPFEDDEAVFVFMNEILDYLEQRQDVLRVMLMESLKRSPVNDLIFRMIEDLLHAELAKAKELGFPVSDLSESMVTEFFTGIMPILNFVVYHDMWMDRFHVDETDLRQTFLKVFKGTHMAFTLEQRRQANR